MSKMTFFLAGVKRDLKNLMEITVLLVIPRLYNYVENYTQSYVISSGRCAEMDVCWAYLLFYQLNGYPS